VEYNKRVYINLLEEIGTFKIFGFMGETNCRLLELSSDRLTFLWQRATTFSVRWFAERTFTDHNKWYGPS
jgi:hypothetical protein